MKLIHSSLVALALFATGASPSLHSAGIAPAQKAPPAAVKSAVGNLAPKSIPAAKAQSTTATLLAKPALKIAPVAKPTLTVSKAATALAGAPKTVTAHTTAATLIKPAAPLAPITKPVLTATAAKVPTLVVQTRTTMANTTAALLQPTSFVPNARGLAALEVASHIAGSIKLQSALGLSSAQSKVIGITGNVANGAGLLTNALEENGGLKNTIDGYKNARSNLAWLATQTTTDQKLAFLTDANGRVTAVALKTAASLPLAAVTLVTGREIPITGQTIQKAASKVVEAAGTVPGRSQLVGPAFAPTLQAKKVVR